MHICIHLQTVFVLCVWEGGGGAGDGEHCFHVVRPYVRPSVTVWFLSERV